MVPDGSQSPSRLSEPTEERGEGHARASSYDVVVIGAGIGGLTAGALLAHAGKKVLVVEGEAQPGGNARALRSRAYTFDRADHLIWGCEETALFGPGLIDTVLRQLGVRDRCEFTRMDEPMYEARFPDLTLSVPHGREAYLEAHLRLFPSEAAGLRRLVELNAEVFRELSAFPVKLRVSDLLFTPRRFPTLFRYRSATVKDVIDRELFDPRLRAMQEALCAWIGPPPSRASFILWAALMAAYVEDGAWYPLGSFQRLADALAAGLTQAGGELVLGTQVTGILAERRQVRGVELGDGQRISAPVVVSNIDPRETFEKLLGPDQGPGRYLRRLRRMELSHSILALYAATDLDVRALGAQHDTSLLMDWDHERAYERALAGELSGLSVLIPTLKDPSLAPPGEHLVILKSIAPARMDESLWDSADFGDRMLELAERVLPGLRHHLSFVHETSPGNRLQNLGPYGGWASTPSQSGPRRLAQQTPVRGLLLVGQWTRPGLGIWTVMASGIGASQFVLGASTSTALLPLRL